MRPPRAKPSGQVAEALRTHRVLVVAPHFDDSPLSAFALMRLAAATSPGSPGVEAITVFTAPRPDGSPSEWDVASGFSSSTEAMALRQEEDRRAMEVVGVRTRHLHQREELYRAPGETERAVSSMQAQLREIVAEQATPTLLAIPAGLGEPPSWIRMKRHSTTIPLLRVRPGGPAHADHLLVRRSLLGLALELAPAVIVYEDLPYAWGGGHEGLLADLTRNGRRAVRESLPVDLVAKDESLRHYASQYASFFPEWSDRLADVFEPVERYWWVTRG